MLTAALVVRDPADHVDAQVERLVEQSLRVGEAQETVLGERDQLHIDHPSQLLADLDQCPHSDQ